MTSYYSTGTVSLVNGSKTVSGTGTLWQTALITGGNIIVEATGNVLPIDTVVDNDTITAELAWTGATGTYNYAIQRDTAYLRTLDVNSQNVAYLLDEIRKGTIFKYDQSGTLSGRAIYDGKPKNFAYLVTEGDTAELYVKASAADGDWDGPYAYGAGPVGPAPTLSAGTVTTLAAGASATATVTGSDGAYALSFGIPRGVQGFKGWTIELEAVNDGLRQVFRVADFIGGEGTKPDGTGQYIGNGGLVANIADAIDFRGLQGLTGPRGVQWRGAWLSSGVYAFGDIVTDNDSEGATVSWIAQTANTNLKPKDNPGAWSFFPASVPATQNDGIWGDTPTSTINDGVWGA